MSVALHFDPFSGIAGDMTVAALLDAGADPGRVRDGIVSLGLPISLDIEKVRKGGFASTYVYVRAPDEKAHRFLPEVEAILSRGDLTPGALERALAIFRRLAEAEAAVHGMPLDRVHFHEVGALDSIADIAGTAIALDQLGVGRVTCGAVAVGSGTVKCEHGVMPVPTPATALLLKGAPLAPTTIKAELTTPTGAAILAATVAEWSPSPPLTIDRIGYGAGTKDFLEQPNVLRVLIGEPSPGAGDCVEVLETNLDDVPGEVIGYCIERLLAAGALDAYAIPMQMKKSRPGVLLGVLATRETASALEDVIFRETRTFGVRRHTATRSKRSREAVRVATPWGPVAAKRGERDGVAVTTPEYEACAAVARQHGVALWDVYDAVRRGGES